MSDEHAEHDGPPEDFDAAAAGERIAELVSAEADALEAEADAIEAETEAAETPQTAADEAHDGEQMGVPCPLCQQGFIPLHLEQSKRTETCPDCNGWGQVLTGSMLEEHAVAPCQTCSGSGAAPTTPVVEMPAPPPPSQEWGHMQGTEADAVQVPPPPPNTLRHSA